MSNKFPFAFQETVAHPTDAFLFTLSVSPYLVFLLYVAERKGSIGNDGHGDFLLSELKLF
jgi:hypothetical protein